ncbi:MAG TPA: family 43 glycosylhydrolase [Bacillota bacterium]|nr:family 43 glycosylhydrolase [Bacillota bacterium]
MVIQKKNQLVKLILISIIVLAVISISLIGCGSGSDSSSSPGSNTGWVDKGKVIHSSVSGTVYNCIDPNFVEDHESNIWLTFGSWSNGIYIIKLDKNTMMPASGATPIHIAKRSKVLANDPDGVTGAIEAPSIIYRNGYYYLFVSFDTCCAGSSSKYKIAYGRSASITGPYVDRDGIMMTSGGGTILDKDDGQYIPGGQFIYNDNGQFLCVHHAYNKSNNGFAQLRIKNLYFDAEGWPTYTDSNTLTTKTWAISASVGVHDPTLIKVNSVWYVFYTGQGIQRRTSADGVNWSNPGKIFSSALSWWTTYAPTMGNNDVWAPDVTYYNGKYWIYYSVSEFGKRNSAIGLICSDRIDAQ